MSYHIGLIDMVALRCELWDEQYALQIVKKSCCIGCIDMDSLQYVSSYELLDEFYVKKSCHTGYIDMVYLLYVSSDVFKIFIKWKNLFAQVAMKYFFFSMCLYITY